MKKMRLVSGLCHIPIVDIADASIRYAKITLEGSRSTFD